MTDNNAAAEKRIVEQLSFGSKTAKRVSWEAWEFTVVGPHCVEVTNASYGFEKDDHSYQVGVEEYEGEPVPAECECPADTYNDEYDCKHKVALATIGGTTVLNAAVAVAGNAATSSSQNVETAADRLKTDGGTDVEQATDECACAKLSGDLPCWPCYRDGTGDD